MKDLRLLFILCSLHLFGSCENRHVSYESQFPDTVTIDFPPGHRFEDREMITESIDQYLRKRKIGFWSGVMGGGSDGHIDSISLNLDFSKTAPNELFNSLMDGDFLPTGSKPAW